MRARYQHRRCGLPAVIHPGGTWVHGSSTGHDEEDEDSGTGPPGPPGRGHGGGSAVLAELDPDCVSGSDATVLYGSFAGLERLAVAGKTLLAPRIETSLVWQDKGHRNAAVLLADLEGVSTGQAGATLALGRRLEALPGTAEELRKGTLSTPKVAELVEAGALDPGSGG